MESKITNKGDQTEYEGGSEIDSVIQRTEHTEQHRNKPYRRGKNQTALEGSGGSFFRVLGFDPFCIFSFHRTRKAVAEIQGRVTVVLNILFEILFRRGANHA